MCHVASCTDLVVDACLSHFCFVLQQTVHSRKQPLCKELKPWQQHYPLTLYHEHNPPAAVGSPQSMPCVCSPQFIPHLCNPQSTPCVCSPQFIPRVCNPQAILHTLCRDQYQYHLHKYMYTQGCKTGRRERKRREKETNNTRSYDEVYNTTYTLKEK